LFALIAAVGPLWGAGLSPQELRGKRIYHQGETDSGATINAKVGMADTTRPGYMMACVNCHGLNGQGRPVGATAPVPNITWKELTRPGGHAHPSGRRHPPFTEASFARAIRSGVDPAGNRLDPAMPRYSVVQSDIEDLIAYLKRIELDLDPGLGAETVRIGAFLPVEGRRASLGRAVRGILEASFAEVNNGGGVEGRRLELVVADASGDSRERIEKFEGLLDRDVFALVSPFLAGIEPEAARLAQEAGIPSVGPIAQAPESGFVVNRTTFYVFGGLAEQGRALLRFAAAQVSSESRRLGLVLSPGELYAGVEEALNDEAKVLGWELVTPGLVGPRRFDPKEAARLLHDTGVEAVLLFGSPKELDGFLGALSALDWTPYLLIPGTLAGPGLMRADERLSGRILLAYPNLHGSHSEADRATFDRLREDYQVGPDHLPAQISAYAAAGLLVEGLKRAGPQVNRGKLVDVLEKVSDFSPGPTPPLSYHPNRRIGALGAWIVSVDLESQTVQPLGWLELEPSL
jgi:ABC-type branched-subunit amino acid transport system substrate-binding protein